MIVYVPAYINGRREAAEIDTAAARLVSSPGYPASIIYRGMIYSGEYIAADPAGVAAYWQRDHRTAQAHRVAAADLWGRAYDNN